MKQDLFRVSAVLIGSLLFSTEVFAEIKCYQCHGTTGPADYRPLDAPYRNASTGGFIGNHRTHMDVSASKSACAKCHPDSNTYTYSHRDGKIKVSAHINGSPLMTPYRNATSAFPQTPAPNLGGCGSVNCHFENATPAWGTSSSSTTCATCHGAPPADGNHPHGTQKHAAYYGTTTTSCVKCHPDHTVEPLPFAHATSAGKRGLVVSFAAAPGNGFGRYTGSNVSYPKYLPSQSPARNGSCKSTYCHSPGIKATGPIAPNQTATWGGTLGCSGCHAAIPATGSHSAHVSSTYAVPVPCYKCHSATISPEMLISSTANHVNRLVDVAFNNSSAAVNGRYSSHVSPMHKTPGSGYANCENVYCHSNGQNEGGTWPPTYSTPKWGNSASGRCGSCHKHGYHNSGAKINSGSHGRHLCYDFTAGGGPVICGVCHFGAGFANPTCTQCHFRSDALTTLHVNHKVDVSFAAKFGGAYNGSPNPGSGYGACSDVYCHSNGSSVATGIIPANSSPVWGSGAPACNGCHENPPAYTTGSPKANSHARHNFGCDKCHYKTTSDGTTISSTTTHVNKVYDVDPAPGITFTYSFAPGGGACTNISCHFNGSAKWGR